MRRLIVVSLVALAAWQRCVAAEDVRHFPFHGEHPFGAGAARACLSNAEALKLENGGVLFGKGPVAPEVSIPGWDGTEGSVAFWVKSVDWLASTKEHVVFLRGVEPKDGSFLVYKYVNSDKIWFYGHRPRAPKRNQVRIHFAYEGIKDWRKDEWRHMAFCWKRGRVAKLFIDGALANSVEGDFFFPESMAGVTFGPGGRRIGMGGKVRSVMRDLYVAPCLLGDAQVTLLARNRPEAAPVPVPSATEFNVVPFAQVRTPPQVDGRIGEAEYPTELPVMVATDAHTVCPEATRFCTAADDENVYVAASVVLPDGHEPNSLSGTRDDPVQIAKGDLFCLFIRPDSDPARKAFKGLYMTVAPNGNIYDALEEIDWDAPSCMRRADENFDLTVVSTLSGQVWTVEARVPRVAGLSDGAGFTFSAGFKFGNRRIAVTDHPVWFDHYQAFALGVFTPLGVSAAFGNLNQGKVACALRCRNGGDEALAGQVRTTLTVPDIRETAAGMVVDKKVGQELEVATRDVLRDAEEPFRIGAGQEVVVRQAAALERPGTYRLQVVVQSGRTVFLRYGAPFVFSLPMALELKPVPSKQQIKAALSFYGVDRERLGQVELAFHSTASGRRVLRQSFPVSKRSETVMVSMATLQPGEYRVDATLFDGGGKEVFACAAPFDKAETPGWLREPKGLEALGPDWAPAPWTPVSVADGVVKVWGREFEFGRDGLLSGIRSQGVQLLAGGIRVKFSVAGAEQAFELAAPAFPLRGRGRAQVAHRGVAAGLALTALQTIEFDGMDRIDVTISPQERMELEKLWIEIPFTNAPLFHASYANSWECGLARDVEFTGLPHLWVGGDKAGCVFFAENCKGWLASSEKLRVTLAREGDARVLRLLVVNEPSELAAPLAFTFGLHPTPVKPFFDGWRAIRPQGWGWTAPPTSLYMAGPTAWMSSYSVPAPRNWDLPAQMLAFVRKHGQTVYPYLTPFYVSMHDMIRRDVPYLLPGRKGPDGASFQHIKDSRRIEPYWHFAEDWNLNPPQYTGDGSARETSQMACVSPSTSWTDYLVGSVHEILSRTDIDGFYFDLAAPRMNFDESRGLAYKTRNGVLEGSMEYFAARDCYKRLYWVFDKLRGPKRKPYILGHGHAGCLPLSSFWDVNFHGEGIKPRCKFEATDLFLQKRLAGHPIAPAAEASAERSWDAYAYRSANGPQFGLPVMYLPQYSRVKGLYVKEHSREHLSWTFLHNNLLWPAYVPAGPVYEFWRKVEIPFGMGHALFHPYWDNDAAATPPCIRVSYWTKPGRSACLLAAANWSAKGEPARIELPPALRSFGSCVDAETGEKTGVTGAALQVDVPHHDLRVFRFGE